MLTHTIPGPPRVAGAGLAGAGLAAEVFGLRFSAGEGEAAGEVAAFVGEGEAAGAVAAFVGEGDAAGDSPGVGD